VGESTNGSPSESLHGNPQGEADLAQGESGVAEARRRLGASARWLQFGRTLYDLIEPSSHLKERARFLFLVKHALRALPPSEVDEIVEQLGSHFDAEMAQDIAAGYDEIEAEARVCAQWMTPAAMAAGYNEVANRRALWNVRSWLTDLCAAIPVAIVLTPHIPYAALTHLFPTLAPATAVGIGAITSVVAIGSLVRRLPVGPLSRGAHKVLRLLDGAACLIYGATAVSAATMTASATVDTGIHALTLQLVISRIPSGVGVFALSLGALELNRRKAKQHRSALTAYLDNCSFHERQFARLRSNVWEVERRTGYFTEDI